MTQATATREDAAGYRSCFQAWATLRGSRLVTRCAIDTGRGLGLSPSGGEGIQTRVGMAVNVDTIHVNGTYFAQTQARAWRRTGRLPGGELLRGVTSHNAREIAIFLRWCTQTYTTYIGPTQDNLSYGGCRVSMQEAAKETRQPKHSSPVTKRRPDRTSPRHRRASSSPFPGTINLADATRCP